MNRPLMDYLQPFCHYHWKSWLTFSNCLIQSSQRWHAHNVHFHPKGTSPQKRHLAPVPLLLFARNKTFFFQETFPEGNPKMFSLEKGTILIFFATHQKAHISNSLVSSLAALWYLLSVVTYTRKVSGVASYPISPFSHSVSFALRDIGKLPNIIWSIGQTLSNIDSSRHNIISFVIVSKP